MSSTERKPAGGIRQVNCPTCQKIVPWSEASPYRPFCSKQCQLIDFGDWAMERNTIPVQEHDNLSFPVDEGEDDKRDS